METNGKKSKSICPSGNRQERSKHSFHTQEDGEAIEVHIVRTGGALVPRTIEYVATPGNPNEEFYGGVGLLRFESGDIHKRITVIARADGEPEVTQHTL